MFWLIGPVDDNINNGAEGGYVNDPDDPGGETKYGISKRAYPHLDIKNLTKQEAHTLYLQDYWVPSRAGTYKFPLAMAVADSAVHHGVGRAKEWSKRTTNWRAYLQIRKEFMLSLNKPKYEKGWINRVNKLEKFIFDRLAPLESE